jgi:hypothetical protein
VSESEPQLIRLRLPSRHSYLYLVRHLGRTVEGYPGADQLETSGGTILAAERPGLILKETGLSDRPQVRMLDLDFRRARRGLGRPNERWTRVVRRTLTDADDVFFDAAASVADQGMADATSGDTPFHQTHQFLWGRTETLLPAEERLRLWDAHMDWLQGRIKVLV